MIKMSSNVKKRSFQQQTNPTEMAETPLSSVVNRNSSEGQLLLQQSDDTGCRPVCHFGHQVVPVGSQLFLGRGQNTEQDKRTRRKRMRARKEDAAAQLHIVGPAPRYLHVHLKFIYYACMIPYKRESLLASQGMSANKKLVMIVLHYLQKVKNSS